MRQPQQQHAIERQQQYWVPVCEGDSEGSGQECPRSGDGQSTRVQGLPWRPARKPTGGSLFSARRARGTNTNGGPGLVAAASAAGNVPALSSVMGADGHEIEAREPNQDPRKPQRGGMVARGGRHAAPTELEEIRGGTVAINMPLPMNPTGTWSVTPCIPMGSLAQVTDPQPVRFSYGAWPWQTRVGTGARTASTRRVQGIPSNETE